jgi:hypothetical protein
MATTEKTPLSRSPGEAKILCEQCLRGSGWTSCYTFLPGATEKTVCQNCDRPAIVRQPKRNSGTHEPSRRDNSKAMQDARAELAKLKAELRVVSGGDSVH